jgi:hypothetical protein
MRCVFGEDKLGTNDMDPICRRQIEKEQPSKTTTAEMLVLVITYMEDIFFRWYHQA